MNQKVLIYVTQEKNNLFEAIEDYMKKEKIEYTLSNKVDKIDKDITDIIWIGEVTPSLIESLKKQKISLLIINDKKTILEEFFSVNYIITNLIHDKTNYTSVQKEYLFKKGIYNILIQKIKELLENPNQYNGMIYDLTELKTKPNNWIFHFDSINETYSWLMKKQKSLKKDFVRKVINFYSNKIYDDSLKEINYLTQKLAEIKERKTIIDVFICTKEELEHFKKNYFFKALLNNIVPSYSIYLINKEKIIEKDREVYEKLLDGIILFDDCVYRDTYNDEISLGFVDCKEETIKEYNELFDYILKTYGHKVSKESDTNEF